MKLPIEGKTYIEKSTHHKFVCVDFCHASTSSFSIIMQGPDTNRTIFISPNDFSEMFLPYAEPNDIVKDIL